jgi:alanine or glycine:cation symporter, AGCS family
VCVETIVSYLNTYLWGFPGDLPWMVVVLLGTGLYVTLRLVFIQVRHLGHSIAVVLGRYDDPDDPGDVSHFQALSTALSATVGIGNIAGVATAVHLGGPGALFWMWVTAVFGMALKFAECTLSVHYRSFDEKGEVAGGPMYYIERGLGKRWKPLAILFALSAIICSFATGNMNQANSVRVSAETEFGIAPWIVGLILVVVVGAVIVGGIRSIGRVTSRLAPTMALIYVLAAMMILLFNAGEIPAAFATILRNAFSPEASVSGAVTGSVMATLLWGVKRGLFSNEAGQGSAPIAHAAAKTKEPVREGTVAMLEPFIDTLLICTMTGLIIVITGVWDMKQDRQVGMGEARVELVAAGEGEATPMDVRVEGGRQSELVFHVADGPVDDARLVLADGTPFSGVLRYDPKAGRVSAAPAEGGAAAVYLQGQMLQTSSALTAWAFKEGLSPLGDWGNYVVTLCVFLFAVSTMISWSYYGDRCVTYLFGARYVMLYRVFYLGFVFLGTMLALQTVWDFGDVALGLMAVPNLIAVFLLTPKIVELSRDYFRRMKERG